MLCYVGSMDRNADIEKDLRCWNLLSRFRRMLENKLSDHPLLKTELDPRRKLSCLDYYSSILFSMLNPVIDSMRGFCRASKLEKVQKKVCSRKVSLGSFSEAQSVFDPELLEQVLEEMASQVDLGGVDQRLRKLPKELTAIDGTLIPALPRMAWALWGKDGCQAAKLHLKFSVERQSVSKSMLTTGKTCERKTLKKMIDPNELLVGDRYYGLDYQWLIELLAQEQWFIFRIRNDADVTVVEKFALTDEDREAGVVFDGLVTLGKDWHGKPIRLVKVEALDTTILLAVGVDRETMSAELVGLAYRYRWQIELFFKWIKCILKCRHLLAESPQGVQIQLYCALIAAMMLFALTGRKPTKRDMEMIQFYFSGLATFEELEHSLKNSR
jgi:hypothetical protein